MEVLDSYKIDFRQLGTGSVEYRFELDDAFFEAVEATLVKSGKATVDLKVKETAGSFRLAFAIRGVVQVSCDRCLDDMDVEIDTGQELTVKLGESYSEEDDLIVLPEDEPLLNVAWNVYEFVALAVPMVHVHEDGQCNEEMMHALERHLVTENQEDGYPAGEQTESGDSTDPRWDELKKILDNN